MADIIDDKQSSLTTRIVGDDEQLAADVIDSNKGKRLLTETTMEPTLVDPFGRMRVSNPVNLFDFSFVYGDDIPSYWDTSTINGATGVQNSTTSQFDLTTTSTEGSKSVIQTRRRMQYFPGKSHLFYFTANPKSVQNGVRKRLGLYDEHDGFYYQANGTEISVVVRSSTSGSIVNTEIPIADWNVDKLDGNGPSGFNALTDNPNGPFNSVILFWIDVSWLGTGGLRFGFYHEGKRFILHEEFYPNKLLTPFTKSAYLPFRVEVETLAGATTGGSVSITCCSYQLEGTIPLLGKTQFLDIGPSEITVNPTGELLVGVRIKDTKTHSTIEPLKAIITVNSGNSIVYWRLLYNPTITGATWTNKPNSITQFLDNQATVTFTGGKVLASGYVGVNNKDFIDLNTDVFLGFSIDDIPDTLVLVGETLSSNSRVSAGITWKEFY